MTAGLPPSPALDSTISVGQSGHAADHEVIAGTLNLLKSAAGKTPAELAADAAFTGAFAALTGATFTGDVVVPDEAYDATAWNGSLEVPTKNAVRDKIESLGGGTVDVVSNVASGVLLGRTTAGSGNSEELTPAQVGTLFSGTSFPGSPSDRQTFFRTDRDIQYFYDLANTRWLSVAQHTASFPLTNLALTTGETAASNSGRLSVPFRATYSILIERFQVATNVQTTNDGTKYWTIKLNWATQADADTQIGTTMNTSAHTVENWYDQFISPNVVVDATARLLKLRVDKVSTPGGLLVTGLLTYRLVG